MILVYPPVFALLLFVLQVVSVVRTNSADTLVRNRRDWVLPARNLKENTDYTNQEYIAKIRSDYEEEADILYSLEGIGANQFPFHRFIVDAKSGKIRVTEKLDREDISIYNLSGVATYIDGRHAEKKIDIRVKVLDENDNAPVFGVISPGVVDELSPAGTSVMKVIATDADEPDNENSQIAYSIICQDPSHDMFNMSPDGTIFVKKPTLDREIDDQYILTVKGQDLNGKPEGNTGTGTVIINVRDVNDNPPILEKPAYEGSIEENTYGVEVLRLKTQDQDLKGTENWEALYEIVKGNEAGYFSIRTDPVTNEGILMLDKAVDYEDVKNLELGIAVKNKAPPHGSGSNSLTGVSFGGGPSRPGGAAGASGASGASGGSSSSGTQANSYSVKITVQNQPEGPRFNPKVKAIPISEGGQINLKDVIGLYPATDVDTGRIAEHVSYARGSDPNNWLIIDPKTAEIRLTKRPDRESKFLVNGTYTAEILCITDDLPAKTATGTIAIQVEDFNDHCPTLTSNIQTVCTTADAVIVSAEDLDVFPNGPPFKFVIIPEGTHGKWQAQHFNDTAVILRSHETLWPGYYKVEFEVTDQQGLACPELQKVTVHVCTCEDGVICGKRGTLGRSIKTAALGAAAIGMLLLSLLMLLLIPLLLFFCQCKSGDGLPWNFAEIPFDTKSHLISYHTEGQGENTDVPLLPARMENINVGMGTLMDMGMINDTSGEKSAVFKNEMIQYPGDFGRRDQVNTWEDIRHRDERNICSIGDSARVAGGANGGIYDGMALPDTVLTDYYTQKMVSGTENLGVKDGLLVYDYEGQGSHVGSVGCCSLLDSDNDLQFLDDLGPKFKTLAEVCGDSVITAEAKQEAAPLPSASITTQTSVSNVVSAPQLPPPQKLQPPISTTEQTVVTKTSARSQVMKDNTATLREETTMVKQGMANQGQMLLLQQQQQPVYYTTTPVLQPMHYVVQPQVQNTVLLAEAPATNLQGMVLVNGTQTLPAQGLVVQGQTVMSTGQVQGTSMVLVERSGLQGAASNVIHNGNLSGSQTMMLMESKVPVGAVKTLKSSQTNLIQGGTLQPGGLSGSPRVLVVGGPTSSGAQLIQEAGGLSQKSVVSGSQKVLYSVSSKGSAPQSSVVGSSTTTVNTTPTYRKVVVQETKEIC